MWLFHHHRNRPGVSIALVIASRKPLFKGTRATKTKWVIHAESDAGTVIGVETLGSKENGTGSRVGNDRKDYLTDYIGDCSGEAAVRNKGLWRRCHSSVVIRQSPGGSLSQRPRIQLLVLGGQTEGITIQFVEFGIPLEIVLSTSPIKANMDDTGAWGGHKNV